MRCLQWEHMHNENFITFCVGKYENNHTLNYQAFLHVFLYLIHICKCFCWLEFSSEQLIYSNLFETDVKFVADETDL